MSLRVLVSIAAAFLFLVPGAYSFAVSIYGGSGGSSFADELTINAGVQDSLLVKSVVNEATLAQDAMGSGDLHKSFAATNHKGERSSITADVVGAGYWEYYQPEIYTDPTSATVTGFAMTANDADLIKCAATAANRMGDKATASVLVTDGSLINYNANAYAFADGVRVEQDFGEASGESIAVAERAANTKGSASTITNVNDGSIFGYADWTETFADQQLVQTGSFFSYAEGSKIESESTAYMSCGYRSNAKMNLEGTVDLDASVNWFNSLAGEGFYGMGFYPMPTGAIQEFYSAQGDLIELSLSSVNSQRALSSASMQIGGADGQSGYIDYYWGLTESLIEPSTESVFAENYFNYVQGDSIDISASSSNKKSDSATVSSNLDGGAFIDYGELFTSANSASASAANSLSGYAGLVDSGNSIDFTASSSNNAMGRATVHSNIQGGSGFISNSASSDSTARTLSAEQEATVFGPALIQGDVWAINTLKQKEGTSWSASVSDEYPLTYGQNASVKSGVPDFGMWAVI